MGGVCIWSYEAIVWVWAQHQMPLIGIPGNATGLVFGKEVQQALGSFWYLLGTAECGAMSETRKLAAILAADVVGYSRLSGADEERTLALLRRSGAISSTQRSRRIATRYDELARNFFSARCFVATLAYWY